MLLTRKITWIDFNSLIDVCKTYLKERLLLHCSRSNWNCLCYNYISFLLPSTSSIFGILKHIMHNYQEYNKTIKCRCTTQCSYIHAPLPWYKGFKCRWQGSTKVKISNFLHLLSLYCIARQWYDPKKTFIFLESSAIYFCGATSKNPTIIEVLQETGIIQPSLILPQRTQKHNPQKPNSNP